MEFMIKEDAIKKRLNSKHNLSALGLDGIGYCHLKFGKEPMIKFLAAIFKDCTECPRQPATCKRSRTALLYKMGKEEELKNWRPITVTSCAYRLFTAMITQWIPDQHSFNKLQIFSRTQKGFVQGQAGCIEHAVITREMISHAQIHRKNLYMVQIDFSNDFGSVPRDLILTNMMAIGFPAVVTDIVKNMYTDNGSKISLVGGGTPFIPWSSGTVQGYPLSPTLFNIRLESSGADLRLLTCSDLDIAFLSKMAMESISTRLHMQMISFCTPKRIVLLRRT
jgi:hypothetical protein